MIEVFYYEGDSIQEGDVSTLEKLKDKKVWVDIIDMTSEEKELIEKTFNLHPVTAEDLFNFHTRIKVEEFNDYLFCVFYGIRNLNSNEFVELDYVLGKNFLITNHKEVIESYNKLKKDKGRLKELFKKGLSLLFYRLLDTEIDNYFPILEQIDDLIENLEEEVTEKPNQKLLSDILGLKRKIIGIKKITFQQREKISFIAKNDYKFICKKAAPYFRDVYDHAVKVSDLIENYREAIGNTFDAYMSSLSNNMNEVMKVLSIIATIALPLTAISGIYGTNFSILPGANSSYGFWVMIFFMLSLSIGMLVYFKKKRWF